MFVILLAGLTRSPTTSTRRPTSTGRSRGSRSSSSRCRCSLPIVLIAVDVRFIDAAKLFDIIYSLTRGGPGTETYTSSYYLYQQGFQLFHLGQGTAGALDVHARDAHVHLLLARARLLKPVEA